MNSCRIRHKSQIAVVFMLLTLLSVVSGGEARWADRNVQHCLDLCTSVDLLHKLLIQEIQPVLGKLTNASFF